MPGHASKINDPGITFCLQNLPALNVPLVSCNGQSRKLIEDLLIYWRSLNNGYFQRWIDALELALLQAGRDKASSAPLSEEVVAGIQGAIVLARGLDDPHTLTCALKRLRHAVLARRIR